LKEGTDGAEIGRTWIERNRLERPAGGYNTAEAFSWLVMNPLNIDGVVGLIMPATSLFNLNSRKYRQRFFTEHEVLRITNFANLRETLFDRRATSPAATIVYRRWDGAQEKEDILHYGPFSVNQVSGPKGKPWVITVTESEVRTISPYEAESGDMSVWKFALWGTDLDKRTMKRIEHLFPTTLRELCKIKGWPFQRDVELPNISELHDVEEWSQTLEYRPDLKKWKKFNADRMRESPLRFSVPKYVLQDNDRYYVRKRGGKAGLKVIRAPHLIVAAGRLEYAIYSDEDFLIASKHMAISAPKGSEDYLRALSLYLNSSLAKYYLFFHAHEWGVFRQADWVSISEVGDIPTPQFTPEQVEELASLQKELVKVERETLTDFLTRLLSTKLPGLFRRDIPISHYIDNLDVRSSLSAADQAELDVFALDLRMRLRNIVDERIFGLFDIDDDMRVLINEFINMRLLLDRPSIANTVTRQPKPEELLLYARKLRDELDDFVEGANHHRVMITHSNSLIECDVEITNSPSPVPINWNNINAGAITISKLLAELSDDLKAQLSQWVYVQRGLRLFDGPKVYIYKMPRLIDWTQTQAINDAGDIIAEAIESA
jgi:hypothetical protein